MEQSQVNHRHSHFHVIKPNRRPQTAIKKSSNIFDGYNQRLLDDQKPISNARIVGGMESFLKQQKRRQGSKQIKNLKYSKPIISTSQKKFAAKPAITESVHTGQTRQQKLKQIKQNEISQHPNHYIFVNFKEEAFKTHQSFKPKNSVSTIKNNKINAYGSNNNFFTCASQVFMPKSSHVSQKSVEWASSQIQNYNNKSAMLTQIAYTQPLHKRYGNRYFQYCLRDRHKDDRPLPPYIYQIKNQTNKSNKFARTLQKFRPDIALKNRLVVQGRLITEQYKQY